MTEIEAAAIVIICDSPRHARGKIAKVAELIRDTNGQWQMAVPRGGRHSQFRRRIRSLDRHYEEFPMLMPLHFEDVIEHAAVLHSLGRGGEQRCKLCGIVAHKPPDEVLSRLAAQGVSQIRIADLSTGSI